MLCVPDSPIIDDSAFPLVIVTFPEYPARETFDAYFARMETIMKRGPIAFVVDIRQVSIEGLSSQLRHEFFRRVAERDSLPDVAGKISECLVASSAVVQQLLASYLTQVQPEGHEITVMTSLEEACAWSLRKIAAYRAGKSG